MTGKAHTGLEAVNNFLYQYLSRRSVEGMVSCVASDVIFTGVMEHTRGIDEFTALMQKKSPPRRSPLTMR